MDAVDEAAGRDPSRVQDPQEFARALSLVRERAGLTVREVHKRTGIVASTLGGYFGGRHRPQVETLEKILAACGVDNSDDVAVWVEALVRVRRADRRRTPSTAQPYRGLAAFRPEHSEWFFGRSLLVESITQKALECAGAGHPLVVVGPSGAGKSSLLGAGVLPALERDHGMRPVLCTPGPDPIPELRRNLPEDDAPAVLVVDQFEELFASDISAVTRMEFAAILSGLASESRTAVVIGLRADFYAHALRLPALAQALQNGQMLVGPMTSKELRAVIVEPAERAGIEVDDGLTELLLEDLDPGEDTTARSVGALPLLSHALLSTWQRSNRIRMTLADYRATGGVRGAIGRSAEDAVDELGPEREEVVRQLFLRLVHVAPGLADTRRRVDRRELDGDAATSEAIDQFVRRRLLVVDGDTVQIAHEAMLLAWPRLQSWIESDRAGIIAHRRLTDAARQWHDHGADPDTLLRGTGLSAATERFHEPAHATDLNDLERRFLAASQEQAATHAAVGQRQTRRLWRLLAAVSVLLLVAATLGVYALVQRNDIAAVRDVAVSRQLAIRSDALRDKDPALAAQLAVAAYRIAPTPEARSSLLNSTAVAVPARVPGPAAVTQKLAIGGGLMASATGSTPTVQIWRLGAGHPELIGTTAATTAAVKAVALSPDARTLAAGSSDGGLVLFDLGDLARPAVPVRAAGAGVLALTFTPDGGRLIAGTAEGLRGWTIRPDGPPLELALPGPADVVNTVAVSPDGQLLAAGADGGTAVTRLLDLAPVAQLPSTGKVFGVAFSPDGRTLAVGGGDRTAHLWNLGDPGNPQPGAVLTGPTNWVNTVAFTPAGDTLAGGSSDGHAWLWDVATGRVTAQLPHSAPVTSAVFLDAGTLATGEADGVAHLWPVHGPILTGFDDAVFALDFDATGNVLAIGPGKKDNTARLRTADRKLGPALVNPPGESPVSGAAAITPDGRTLAVGRVDGSVRLWDVSDPQHPRPIGAPLVGPTALVEQLAISADGRHLAVSGDDNLVWLWDITDPAAARPRPSLHGATSYVLASAFSPDGRLLAAASADTNTYLWNLDHPEQPRLLATLAGPSSYAYSPVFSPDGRLLAVGNADKTVRLWDVSNPARPTELGAPLVGPSNYVYSTAISPDGKTLAGASTDGTVWLWDITDPRAAHPLATLTGPTDAVFSVTWTPDGRHLLAGSADRTVRTWAAAPDQATTAICAAAGSPVTAEEWTRFVPDLPFQSPCGSAWPTPQGG